MAIEILHNVILIGCFVAVSFYNFISSTPSFLRKEKGAVVFNLNGTSKVLALWEFALFNIRVCKSLDFSCCQEKILF